MQWVIDKILLEKHDEGFGFPSLEEAARSQGHDVYLTKYIPFSETQGPEIYTLQHLKPTIFYGCCEWINKLERNGILKNYVPGIYLRKDALRYSNYSWRYHEHMLNKNYFILRYGEIKKRPQALRTITDICDFLPFFIRPDVVTKSFPGHIIKSYKDIELLSTYDKIYDDELCVIAPVEKIIGEYRHIICNREVIAQSQYKRNNILDIRIDVNLECQALAKWISREEYQIDNVYVVDTALINDGPKIIEFNAFSCSGLYAMDTNKIVKHISEVAEIEFKGEE